MKLFNINCICAVIFAATTAFADSATVQSTADIFSSGQTTANASRGGVLPTFVPLPVGIDRLLTFSSVTGSANAGPGVWIAAGPDGNDHNVFGTRFTNIFSASGISGMKNPQILFLAGVFLDDTSPVVGTQPAILDFNSIGLNFTDLSPLKQQTFFIGDGLTGTGSGTTQTFHIPNGATRLFLGTLDASDFGWSGAGTPGQYGDNTGSFIATYQVTGVPEPGTGITLALMVLAGIHVRFRRRPR